MFTCMTNFVQNLMAVDGLKETSLYTSAFLILNLPGQPMTIYDKNKVLNSNQMADVYDRLIFSCVDQMAIKLEDLQLTFLSFGYGSFIASTLAINLGKESRLISKFVSFNGIFHLDAKVTRAFQQLSEAIKEGNPSVHLKLLDVANNCRMASH
jgi:hypothetical protein